jgi:hypothetical protein
LHHLQSGLQTLNLSQHTGLRVHLECQRQNGEEGEKGTSDDEPENDTFAKVKRMPRRSLFMEEMTIPLPKPHTTPEKTLVPDMPEDNRGWGGCGLRSDISAFIHT